MKTDSVSACLYVGACALFSRQALNRYANNYRKSPTLKPFGKSYPQHGAEEALSERVPWSGDQEDDKMMLIAKEMEIVVHSLNY